MVIGINEPCQIGAIVRLDLIDGDKFREDIPVMILREATHEEWVSDRQGYYTEDDARQALARRLDQFPLARLYHVGMD